MLMEFAARLLNRLICATTHRRGSHNLFDSHFGRIAVISGHAATHVALGDDTDQFETFCTLNHRRAAAA